MSLLVGVGGFTGDAVHVRMAGLRAESPLRLMVDGLWGVSGSEVAEPFECLSMYVVLCHVDLRCVLRCCCLMCVCCPVRVLLCVALYVCAVSQERGNNRVFSTVTVMHLSSQDAGLAFYRVLMRDAWEGQPRNVAGKRSPIVVGIEDIDQKTGKARDIKAAEKLQSGRRKCSCWPKKRKTQGSKDENNRVAFVRVLRRLKKYREEEDALKLLLEELQDEKKIQEDEFGE